MDSSEAKSGRAARAGVVLRSVVFYTVFGLVTLFVSLSVILLSPWPRTMALRRKLEGFWAGAAVRVGGVRVVSDVPDLDPDGNYVFLANHQSHMDIPIILSLFPEFRPRFLAKESLFKIPIFGPGMAKTGHFSVDRENRRQGMKDLQKVVDSVQQGESALVFPEGTRNSGSDGLLPFQSGAFILLLKSNVPAVPLVLDGSNRILPRGAKWLRSGTVRIRALAPVNVAERYSLKDRESLKQEMWRTMQNEFLEISSWQEERTG
ncbi:MAG: 1-acyl-sn-glycerol-3-phosphate acyltransferase [Desulfohalobiaceae bacterium]|nr:1-acyl-sn-glycerol-3-phosphate acyltransferase [Desulfohalobiaceae bacterium]